MSLQSPLRPYLENLSSRHSEMTALHSQVSQDGAGLTDMFKPVTGETVGDSGRSARIAAQRVNLETHCQRVEQLWKDAWEREGKGAKAGSTPATGTRTKAAISGKTSDQAGKPGKGDSMTSRPSGKASTEAKPSSKKSGSQGKAGKSSQAGTAKTGQTSTAKAGPTSQVGKTGQTSATKTSQTGSEGAGKAKPAGKVGKAVQKRSSQAYTQPPTTTTATNPAASSRASESKIKASLKANSPGASSLAAGSGKASAKRLSDTYGDLEAEAYKVSKLFRGLFTNWLFFWLFQMVQKQSIRAVFGEKLFVVKFMCYLFVCSM